MLFKQKDTQFHTISIVMAINSQSTPHVSGIKLCHVDGLRNNFILKTNLYKPLPHFCFAITVFTFMFFLNESSLLENIL